MRPLRVLLFHAQSTANATLSYQHAWPRQFQSHPRFACTPINLADTDTASKVAALVRIKTWRGDAVVMLHSVFSNGQVLAGRLFDAVRALRSATAFFIGNEYKLMPEKMQFCEDLDLSLLVSQCRSESVHQLYRERLRCAVIDIPYTGLDPKLFASTTPRALRPVDLGYRAAAGPEYLGHRERTAIAEYFQAHADRLGLRVDLSLDARDRFDEVEWAAFLNRCKGQLGVESGGDYFELTDRTRLAVNAFMHDQPTASFDDIHRRFFANYEHPLPLRVISGRNVEAAGTRTVQMLFEGRYDDYFQPDVHYIPLRKDFGNIDDAVRKFRDDDFCRVLTENAYRVAATELTYARLLDRFADALAPLI